MLPHSNESHLSLKVLVLPSDYLFDKLEREASHCLKKMCKWVSGSLSASCCFFFFFFIIILLYNIVLVLPYIDESATGVHVFPILNPSSHLPSHPNPLGYPSAPVPSTLSHASNLDWQFISHMIIYMFQYHSPISSHPCPLLQSPKDCSTHLCLFRCLAYRVTITIFLNSIYMH